MAFNINFVLAFENVVITTCMGLKCNASELRDIYLEKINRTRLGKDTHMYSIAKLHIALSLCNTKKKVGQKYMYPFTVRANAYAREFSVIFFYFSAALCFRLESLELHAAPDSADIYI